MTPMDSIEIRTGRALLYQNNVNEPSLLRHVEPEQYEEGLTFV